MDEDLVQLFNQAHGMEEADDSPGALKIYDEIIKKWSNAKEQHIRSVVNDSLERKIDLLSALHDSNKEFLLSSVSKLHDVLIRRFFESRDKEKAGRTYLNKAEFLRGSCEEYYLAYELYGHIVNLFSSNSDPEIRNIVLEAYDAKLELLDHKEDECVGVAAAYANYVLTGEINHAMIVTVLDLSDPIIEAWKFEDAFSLYEALLSKIDSVELPDLVKGRLSALYSKGHCLELLGRAKEAIHVFTDVLVGAKNDDDLNIADALIRLGHLFAAIDRTAHGIAHFDEVVTRFGNTKEMEAIVAEAVWSKYWSGASPATHAISRW